MAIGKKTKVEWKRIVEEAVEKKNKNKLIAHCTTEDPAGTKVCTKTRDIHHKLTTDPYSRKPLAEIATSNKQRTKTIVLARSGMLICGTNFKGTMSEICQSCHVRDDEHHRLNICTKWGDTNRANNPQKVNFDDIYSDEYDTLDPVINEIEKVWELKYANGRMKILQ